MTIYGQHANISNFMLRGHFKGMSIWRKHYIVLSWRFEGHDRIWKPWPYVESNMRLRLRCIKHAHIWLLNEFLCMTIFRKSDHIWNPCPYLVIDWFFKYDLIWKVWKYIVFGNYAHIWKACPYLVNVRFFQYDPICKTWPYFIPYQLFKLQVWLKITDENSLLEMRIWSILLI